MKFLFIYIEDIKDAVRSEFEKSGKEVNESEFETIFKQVKKIFGPHNPIAGNPRLGILTLASILRKKFGPEIEIKYCDMSFECLEAEDLRSKLRGFKPDFVGLSCILPFAHIFHQVTKVVKEELPHCRLLAGGPYISSAAKRAMVDKNVDVGVILEAEETLPELIEVILRGDDLKGVKGICYRSQGKLIFTKPRPLVQDLDKVPWPAIDLINLDDYSKAYRVFSTPQKSMPLFTSRGCTYECTFCHNLSGKTIRLRSAEDVFEEIQYYYDQHKVREFFVWDDIFNSDLERTHKIMDRILKSKMKIRFSFPRGLRGDLLTHELIDKMVEAGLCMTSFAIESASPRIQKMIKKLVDLEKLAEVIDYTVKKGVLVNTFNMIDFPSETEEEMKKTLEYNLGLPHHNVSLFKLSPFEGTEIHHQIGVYDQDQHLGAFTLYKYKKKILSDVSPEFLEKFIKEFGIKFFFDKNRLQNALQFKSPHVEDEVMRNHFKMIYQIALRHYNISENEIQDQESVEFFRQIMS